MFATCARAKPTAASCRTLRAGTQSRKRTESSALTPGIDKQSTLDVVSPAKTGVRSLRSIQPEYALQSRQAAQLLFEKVMVLARAALPHLVKCTTPRLRPQKRMQPNGH